MLTVETIGRSRREFHLKGKTIKEIVRYLRVSRNTVQTVRRSGAKSFEYEREIQPRPKLEAWRTALASLLDQCVAYAKAHGHPEAGGQTVWSAFEAEIKGIDLTSWGVDVVGTIETPSIGKIEARWTDSDMCRDSSALLPPASPAGGRGRVAPLMAAGQVRPDPPGGPPAPAAG